MIFALFCSNISYSLDNDGFRNLLNNVSDNFLTLEETVTLSQSDSFLYKDLKIDSSGNSRIYLSTTGSDTKVDFSGNEYSVLATTAADSSELNLNFNKINYGKFYFGGLFLANNDGTLNITATDFYVENKNNNEWNANVVRALINGSLNINSKSFTAINNSPLNGASTIFSSSDGKITILAKDVYVLARGNKGILARTKNNSKPNILIDTSAYKNGTTTVESYKAQTLQGQGGTITILSDNVVVNQLGEEKIVDNIAVRSDSNGSVFLKGKIINISGPTALSATANGLIDISVLQELNIWGDIGNTFNSSANEQQVNKINIAGKQKAKININNDIKIVNELENLSITINGDKESIITTLGNIETINHKDPFHITTNESNYIHKINFILNQSSWNIVGTKTHIDILNSNHGIVDLSKTTKESIVQIDSIVGEETTFKVANKDLAQTKIGNNQSKKLTVEATGKYNDQVNDAHKLASSLASVLTIQDGEKDLILTTQEGKIAKSMHAEFKNGLVQNIQVSGNGVTETVQDVMGLQVLSFRNQINDVQKRMGDLRLDKNVKGTWIRVFGGDVKFGDMGLKNKYNTIQAGADAKVGNAYFGVMTNLTKGDSKMNRGTGEDKTYGLGIYAGYMEKNGWYIDTTLKQIHMQNKFKAQYTSGEVSRGSYNTWGTSISLEVGKHMKFSCGFFIEPQSEFMYGKVQGIDYTTSANVKVQQKAFESLIGRAGLSVGKTFKAKGSVYANVSVLNDFAGKTETSFTYQNQRSKTSEDMGGMWTEFAIGGTYKLNQNTALYGEFATNKGNNLTNPILWSIGLRLSF